MMRENGQVVFVLFPTMMNSSLQIKFGGWWNNINYRYKYNILFILQINCKIVFFDFSFCECVRAAAWTTSILTNAFSVEDRLSLFGIHCHCSVFSLFLVKNLKKQGDSKIVPTTINQRSRRTNTELLVSSIIRSFLTTSSGPSPLTSVHLCVLPLILTSTFCLSLSPTPTCLLSGRER